MSYYEKYIKYKMKYFTLKSNLEFAVKNSKNFNNGKMKYIKYKKKYSCKNNIIGTTKVSEICKKDQNGKYNTLEECAFSDECNLMNNIKLNIFKEASTFYILDDTHIINNLFYYLPGEVNNNSMIDYGLPDIIKDLGFFAPVTIEYNKKMTSIFNISKVDMGFKMSRDFITITNNLYVPKTNYNSVFEKFKAINELLLRNNHFLRRCISSLHIYHRWSKRQINMFIKESKTYFFTLEDCKKLMISKLILNYERIQIMKEKDIINSVTDEDIDLYLYLNNKNNYLQVVSTKTNEDKYKIQVIAFLAQIYELKNISLYCHTFEELSKRIESKIFFLNTESYVYSFSSNLKDIENDDDINYGEIDIGISHSTAMVIDKDVKKIIHFDTDCTKTDLDKLNHSIKIVNKEYSFESIFGKNISQSSFQDIGKLEYKDYIYNCNLLAILFILIRCINPKKTYLEIKNIFEKNEKGVVLDWCYNLITWFKSKNRRLDLTKIIWENDE